MALSEVARNWLLQPVLSKLKEMREIMADNSQVLDQVAQVLSTDLYTSVAELVAENAALRGEDAAESAATQRVEAAVAKLGGLFAAPELPEVPTELPPAEELPAEVDPNA